jgi:hypothetical protein
MCTVDRPGRHGIPATENNRREEHPFRENFEQEKKANLEAEVFLCPFLQTFSVKETQSWVYRQSSFHSL